MNKHATSPLPPGEPACPVGRGEGEGKIIHCACGSKDCPAELTFTPQGQFMRVKSVGGIIALDRERALEIILELADHFHVDGIFFRKFPHPLEVDDTKSSTLSFSGSPVPPFAGSLDSRSNSKGETHGNNAGR